MWWISSCAVCSRSMILSPNILHIHIMLACCSVNRFPKNNGMRPGVSKNSISVFLKPPILCHVNFLVPPATPFLRATFRPVRQFMIADLPTFGMPVIAARMARGLTPFRLRLRFTWAPLFMTSIRKSSTPMLPLCASIGITGQPRSTLEFLMATMVCSRATGGTRSALVSTITRGLPRVHSGMSGCLDVHGMRASRTSTMTSTRSSVGLSFLIANCW
mmetsp:Transcript_131292/g.327514  ORF Transcript_131292/g.327514 Transcript_131292/m.327514 type:complete len:217 (+) Transcript_131292:591-1241(+)